MTLHIVCLDGTGQVKLQPHPTNIARIFDGLGGAAEDAGNGSWETSAGGQTGKYLCGVGTQGDAILKLLGQAWGDGIAEPIVRGYTYLSRRYQPGDEIILTGFSRGATAARALAGLIVAKGLLAQGGYDPGQKTGAYLRAVAAWYAYREPKGSLIGSIGFELISGLEGLQAPRLTATDFTAPPPIRAVAVFDTVSSLGLALPTFGAHGFGATFDFSICDTALSSDIAAGFHALAADETRDLFSPTLWAGRQGVVQQVFPGCHSDVGGGYPNRGLSDGALGWMLAQLATVGLVCDLTGLDPPFAPDPLAPAQSEAAMFPFSLTPLSARAFPDIVEASEPLNARRSQPTEMIPAVAPSPYRPIGTYADGRPL